MIGLATNRFVILVVSAEVILGNVAVRCYFLLESVKFRLSLCPLPPSSPPPPPLAGTCCLPVHCVGTKQDLPTRRSVQASSALSEDGAHIQSFLNSCLSHPSDDAGFHPHVQFHHNSITLDYGSRIHRGGIRDLAWVRLRSAILEFLFWRGSISDFLLPGQLYFLAPVSPPST